MSRLFNYRFTVVVPNGTPQGQRVEFSTQATHRAQADAHLAAHMGLEGDDPSEAISEVAFSTQAEISPASVGGFLSCLFGRRPRLSDLAQQQEAQP